MKAQSQRRQEKVNVASWCDVGSSGAGVATREGLYDVNVQSTLETTEAIGRWCKDGFEGGGTGVHPG